jgi:hypothetical protein
VNVEYAFGSGKGAFGGVLPGRRSTKIRSADEIWGSALVQIAADKLWAEVSWNFRRRRKIVEEA